MERIRLPSLIERLVTKVDIRLKNQLYCDRNVSAVSLERRRVDQVLYDLATIKTQTNSDQIKK